MININATSDEELNKKIGEWLTYDQYGPTKNEILDLINKNEWNELKKRLFNRVQFGTAALRKKFSFLAC